MLSTDEPDEDWAGGLELDDEEAEPAPDALGPERVPDFQPTETVVSIVRRQLYSFDGRIASTQTAVLAKGIDTSWWRSGVLAVVLHAKGAWTTSTGAATNATLIIKARAVRLDEDAPEVNFQNQTELLVAQVGPIVSSTSAPRYLLANFNAPWSQELQVDLELKQGSLAAGGAQTATLSIHLVGRGA